MQRVESDQRAQVGIKTLDWPANLSDLHKVEACYNPLKDEISTFHLVGASVARVEEAKVQPHTSTVCA
jgi:hypothetical protein